MLGIIIVAATGLFGAYTSITHTDIDHRIITASIAAVAFYNLGGHIAKIRVEKEIEDIILRANAIVEHMAKRLYTAEQRLNHYKTEEEMNNG